MPSLPPSSWTTTRMRPSRPGRAAIAVRERKPGRAGASESRAERFRIPRRVSMMESPLLSGEWRLLSGQLSLRSREQQGDGAVESVGFRAAFARRLLEDQPAGGRFHRATKQEVAEEAQGLDRVVDPTVAGGQAAEVGGVVGR